jgi:hypothetical protein
LRTLSGKLQGKIESITQMLPHEPKGNRDVSAIVGKLLKSLFGTALSEDLASVIDRLDSLRWKVGDLVHDAEIQMTVMN